MAEKLGPKAIFALCGYMGCSSLLLICNKLAVHHLPAASFVLLGQMLVCAITVKSMGVMGVIEVDELKLVTVKSFMLAVVAFVAVIYCNVKTLQYANVETFIVFRASTPVLISVADYLFLGRELPNLKSAISIAVLLFGAFVYVYTDEGFQMTGYTWLAFWYVIFLFDQLYLKFVADTVQVSNWGKVFYQNFLSSFPLTLIFFLSGDYEVLRTFEWTMPAVAAFLISCVLGTAMSYFAWMARTLVSATYFSVVGNVCKLLTVIINLVIWDFHANYIGTLSLLVCLTAAFFYEQAPMRKALLDEQNNKDSMV